MTTCAEMLTELNDRINDAGNSQVTQALKISYLNHGIRATWPRLYKVVRDDTLLIDPNQYEYEIPDAVGDHAAIVRVEVEIADNRFGHLQGFEIVPHLTERLIQFNGRARIPSGLEARRIRITAANALTEFTGPTSEYDGPRGTEELPVLYALGVTMGRRLDDRLDHRRYSTTAAVNGVGTQEIMTSSQWAFAQFELLLDRFAMPLPVQGG